MTEPLLRLGTRGSQLALTQSGLIADALRRLGARVEMVVVRTAGDTRAPDTVWGEGAFVTALEVALLEGRIDVAVHSAKDVPTTENPFLRIAAYPIREDPRDALVTRETGVTLETLPRGARIGTDSPRRVAFLRAFRPDLRPHPLHGNVDTRLRKLEAGETDALILAVAGLSRLGLADRIGQLIPTSILPPAPGQGALAVQCRAADPVALGLVGRLDDPATRAAVEAERAFLAASGGGCRAPIGAIGSVAGGTLTLVAAAADPAAVATGDAPAEMAAMAPGTTFTRETPGEPLPAVAWARREVPVAGRFEAAGFLAADLAARLPGGRRAPVVVTREAGRAGSLIAALEARGLAVVHVPAIAIEPAAPAPALLADLRAAANNPAAWVIVTSVHGVAVLATAAAAAAIELRTLRVAVVGAATAAAVAQAGGEAAFVARPQTAAALAESLPVEAGTVAVLVQGDLAGHAVASALRERGADVRPHVGYRTVEGPVTAAGTARAVLAGDPAAFAFASGSAVRGLAALAGLDAFAGAVTRPAVCLGPSTAEAARAAGFRTILEAPAGDLDALADLAATVLATARASAPVPVAHPNVQESPA